MYWEKVVVIGQKWFFSGKVVVFRQKWLYSGKSGYIRAKSGCLLEKWLHSDNVGLFGQK